MKAVKLPFWFLVGLRKTQLKCCFQAGIFGLTWEKTEDSKTNKKQLRNYCVKEYFNSERIMWRSRDVIPQQKVLVDDSRAALLENTCRGWPTWCVNVVWCHLGWVDAATALLCIDQTAEVARSLQLRVWVAKLMPSASKEFGDGLLCLTHPSWLENTFCSSSFTSGICRAERFNNSVLPIFMWRALHFPLDT